MRALLSFPTSGSRECTGRTDGMAKKAKYRIGNRNPIPAGSRVTEDDLYLWSHGGHHAAHRFLGAHPSRDSARPGVSFSVWAPRARSVAVIGEFNGWNPETHPLVRLGSSGIWTGVVENAHPGHVYKFHIVSREKGYTVNKADPFAFATQLPSETGSRVCDLSYEWSDEAWMRKRRDFRVSSSPVSIYEMHIGSWRRPDDPSREFLSYEELADQLVPYLQELGFTHVEFLPPMEHPFYGSWGYQTTGYFAPSARYGTPQQFKRLIDRLHRAGIGVVLDWVPSHFPSDEHGLGFFDGGYLFEYSDPKLGYHPDWKSYIFNYGRNEVRSFLVSSAMFWVEEYHVDAIRVDAVASMLHLDYSRDEGQWIANKYGGRENLEAITFLRQLNTAIHDRYPDVLMIAEESTSWPMVSRPVHLGGLGFDMKWDMGWMHDTLDYLERDAIHRKFHHEALTFRSMYAYSENFVLPLSHDEVVHGKRSLVDKMPGDVWQRLATLRALFGLMYTTPGKKLLFMGGEFGQWLEWNHDASLQWGLLQNRPHEGLRRWVRDLNHFYRASPALHGSDFNEEGFSWIDCSDSEQSIVSYVRRPPNGGKPLVIVANLTPVIRADYRIGVPHSGRWNERLNSDAEDYSGSGVGNMGGCAAVAMPYHGQPFSVVLQLPPLGVLVLESADVERPLPGKIRGGPGDVH